MSEAYNRIVGLLGDEAQSILDHTCTTIPKSALSLPGGDFVDRIFAPSDRSIPVLRSLQSLYSRGRLADTGYLSILPVDQGIEHTAGASFAPNPIYFDPENIIKLAPDPANAVVDCTSPPGVHNNDSPSSIQWRIPDF